MEICEATGSCPNEEHMTEMAGAVLTGAKLSYLIGREVLWVHDAQYYLCSIDPKKARDGETDKGFLICMVADKDSLQNCYDALGAALAEARELHYIRKEDMPEGRFSFSFTRPAMVTYYNCVSMWHLGAEIEQLHPEPEWTNSGVANVHYERMFPRVVEKLMIPSPWGGERPAMVLRVDQDPTKMLPLWEIVEKGYRVDLQTSAWIVNRMLKLLVFYRNHEFSLNGFMIDPENHELVYLDWSKSWAGDIDPRGTLFRNLQRIGKIALNLIDARRNTSGETVKYDYAYEMSGKEQKYLELLVAMARLDDWYLNFAHTVWQFSETFWESVKRIWDVEFHPFTAYRINSEDESVGDSGGKSD